MIGKASEIKTADLDVREINDWLKLWPEVIVIDIKYCITWSETIGALPRALIIYKEGSS
jgi:hypothetical protein